MGIVSKIAAGIGVIGAAAGYVGAIDALHMDPALAEIRSRSSGGAKIANSDGTVGGAKIANRDGTVNGGKSAKPDGTVDGAKSAKSGKSGRTRIACVGDSITYGCFVMGQPWNSYPRQLGRMLGDGYVVANFGYTNRTAIRTADHPYTAERLYRRSLEFRPDIVLIMLGTNDSKACNWDAAAYHRDMIRLIESYQELESHPEVILMLPPPVFTIQRRVLWDIRQNTLTREVIPMLRKIAGEKDLRLIDTHGPFLMRRELFVDGVHPNAAGAKRLAEIVCETIGRRNGSEES